MNTTEIGNFRILIPEPPHHQIFKHSLDFEAVVVL
jgi:hypothetical protein